MTRYPKGRILNICSICVLYIFVFKIDIFSLEDKISNDNSCPEDNYFSPEEEHNFLLEEEYNPGNDMENKSYIKDIIIGEKDYNQEEINMVGQNIYDDKNIEGNNILCCSSGLPLKNQKNFETNYNFKNYIDEGKSVANTSIKIKKKDLNLENLLLKKRKRRAKGSIKNSIKELSTRKTNRGRYKKNDQSSINYVPNVNDYSDKRHSKYSLDNIILKIKTLIIKELILFLNNKITKIYKSDEFHSELKKLLEKHSIKNAFEYTLYNIENMFKRKQILFNLNGNFVLKSNTNDDKKLLNKKIKEIVSKDISGKFKNYNSEHNKFIIEVIQENDEIKKILDLTFLDCVNHFCLEKTNENLTDFANWNTYFEKIEEEDGEEYKKCFYEVLVNFENFVSSRWTRGKNKKNNK